MRDRRGGLVAAVAILMAIATGPGALAASRTVEVENVRVGFQERFKVGTWTPVWVSLRGGLEGFNGVMEVITPDEDGTPTAVSQPVQVASGGSQRVTAYVRPGSLDTEFAMIRLVDGKTGRLATPEAVIGNLMGSKPPDSLSQDDFQILALGKPSGVELIPTLPGYNATKGNAAAFGRAREVSVARLSAADDLLPGRWYGYDSVDVAVLDTNDKEMMTTLASGRGEALRQWVERGGHLVVAVSGNWQAVNDGPIGPMLPARVAGQSQVSPFDSLESFTGGSQQVAFENAPTRVARLEDIEARGGKVIASTLSTPLVVRGAYGFGRVTLVGLDVDTKPFAAWPDRTLFWIKALDLKGFNAGVDATKPGSSRFIRADISDMATLLRRALDQFEGVKLIPFGWVAAFIVVYILLIGPGDYFFLKKVLKRMELTWITFPTIVVTVSLLAYYAAYVAKGTDLRVNKVDVVDIDLESKLSRGTSWANLFSPQNRDYSVALVPSSLLTEPPTAPGAPVVAPPAGTEVVTTWFAAPEFGLRGMNTKNRGMGFGASGYSYGPMGKVEDLEGVRIGIWSTKGFVGRWFGPAPAPGSVVDVDLQAVGTDRLAGTITNKLPIPLEDAIVAFGKQVYYNVGTIAPGQTIEVDKALDRTMANYLQERKPTFVPANYYANQAERISRPDLLREMMFHDSDTLGQESIPSRLHREIDLTGQLALGRPMLVARVARPAARLVLGNTPSPPKIEQTTLLRVILPLKKEGEAPKAK